MKLENFQLERYFADYEFTAPYLLCSSDCESMPLGQLLALEAGADKKFSSLWLGYTDPKGSLELRQAVTGLYEQVSPDQVLVHAGAEEAIFNFMNVAIGPGDHIIVQTPCYQSLGEVARGIGAKVTAWKGDPDRAWEPDLDTLRGALTARTRVVVINFPHNPTGFLPSMDYIHELSMLSERHDFIIFSDEVYRGLELDPSHRLPALTDISDKAVSLGVMSKTYGLAGLRIGWIATRNTRILKELTAFKDYTTICNSAPSEFLAALGLRHAGNIVKRNLEIIAGNLDRLDRFFELHEGLFSWHRPRAGSISLVKLLRGRAENFCADLVRKKGVLLAPGIFFGAGSSFFRVGFGRRNLPEALERLEEYVTDNYPFM